MEWVSNGFAIVEVLALAAGVVLAVVTWRRQPTVALLAALGLGALLLANVAWLLEVLVLPAVNPGQISLVVGATSAVTAVLRVAGLVLLMLALIRRARRAPTARGAHR